ncbi:MULTISPECIES: TetR/AcrR family transcriptional regulator [Cryobacterium]|uniref:TetR family transcriptional regulator n=1 Tax=Cryobacterium glucosi TaxID=1259175 RepID=A0ABY2ITS1_9MICO|nr:MULTISPECIES: TetR/AcrR family transcriptional regulator [Cryobacterium]MDY7528261.1 helix-turn-helix domain-containing protein [Cryobacterium sp. 10C2]MDY7555992.1 helix-turn-helix domain-containing protein [Cryobacterium sp. 10C3]MEB0200944.1 helix-turn-helix domain-containing protein [Cryobacterium sp. 5I3]MEB0286294.1 helix-turn-helix domain-containing protein [Cryobacterium sp. 10S3]MEB0290496.1 helix-turn-helix domain-containing protein [Cryobacterium sp. 10C2]
MSSSAASTQSTPTGPGPDEGLRARKRAATQAALEAAAISQASEHGYHHVTVDMICEAAQVSQRTFFNYFATKEAAFLGASPPIPSEGAVKRFITGNGGSVLAELVLMIESAIVASEPDRDVLRARRTLIENTPELFSSEIIRLAELEDRLAGIVLQRFEARGRTEATTPDILDEAHMVVGLAVSILRFAMRKASESDYSADPRAILRHAIGLVERITGVNPFTTDAREPRRD